MRVSILLQTTGDDGAINLAEEVAALDKLTEHKRHVAAHGVDTPEVRDWHSPSPTGPRTLPKP